MVIGQFAPCVSKGGKGFPLELGNFCGREHRHGSLFWNTIPVLSRQEVATLHHGDALHGVLLDKALLGQVAKVFVKEDVDFLHSRIGVALFHPMVQHGFQVSGGDVPHDFVPDEREHLVLGGTFQPVVCGALYRRKLENLEPMGQALPYGFLGLSRAAHFLVELCDVVGNLLLGFRFRLAGEHLATLDALLIKVPDDTLPAAIRSPKNVAICCESFFVA